MWVLVCATLVVGALGHYRFYDPRSVSRDQLQNDLEQRQEPAYSDYGVQQAVDFRMSCPGCKRSSNYNLLNKLCVEEYPAKKCEHGHYMTYDEFRCPRKNCYKGLGENCTDSNCAPSYTCKLNSNNVKTCETTLDSLVQYNPGFIPEQFHMNRYRL